MALVDLSDDGHIDNVRLDKRMGVSAWRLGRLNIGNLRKFSYRGMRETAKPAHKKLEESTRRQSVFENYLSDESEDDAGCPPDNVAYQRRYLSRCIAIAPVDSTLFVAAPVSPTANSKAVSKPRHRWSIFRQYPGQGINAKSTYHAASAPRVPDSITAPRVFTTHATPLWSTRGKRKPAKVKRHESWISTLKVHVRRHRNANTHFGLINSLDRSWLLDSMDNPYGIESSGTELDEPLEKAAPFVPQYPRLRSQPSRHHQIPHAAGYHGSTLDYSRSDIAFVPDLENEPKSLSEKHTWFFRA